MEGLNSASGRGSRRGMVPYEASPRELAEDIKRQVKQKRRKKPVMLLDAAEKNSALAKWMIAARGDEIARLATGLGSSPQYLYQLARGYRRASAEMAGLIELLSFLIRESGGEGAVSRLPLITRVDLCNACKTCPHADKSQTASV